MSRRQFLVMVGAAGAALAGYRIVGQGGYRRGHHRGDEIKPGEDVFAYISRVKGGFDQTLYRQVIGAANDFKEGDQAIGVAAADEATRSNARALLANTKIKDLHEHPLLVDDLQQPDLADHGPGPVRQGPGLDHGPAERVPPVRGRARDQGRHVRPDQRHDRLCPEADEQSRAHRAGSEDLQRAAGHQDGGEGLHGRPHPAQLAHGPPRGRGLAGLRCLRLRDGRHRHRHQPRGQHGHERRRGRTARSRTSSTPSGWRTRFPGACFPTSMFRRRWTRAIRERSPRCSRASPEPTTATRRSTSPSRRS